MNSRKKKKKKKKKKNSWKRTSSVGKIQIPLTYSSTISEFDYSRDTVARLPRRSSTDLLARDRETEINRKTL